MHIQKTSCGKQSIKIVVEVCLQTKTNLKYCYRNCDKVPGLDLTKCHTNPNYFFSSKAL